MNPPKDVPVTRSRLGIVLHSRAVLLVAFAFAVMADPVSSVAYAIEAALRAQRSLSGDIWYWLATSSISSGEAVVLATRREANGIRNLLECFVYPIKRAFE